MTNTTFRKRALLSSVAMLLVALVALGSATFAWFTSNPVAAASGITAKGQTSTGLVLKTSTDRTPADSHNAEFMKSGSVSGNMILVPAILKDSSGASFFSTTASVSSSWAADPTGTWSSVNVKDSSTWSGTGTFALGEGVYKEVATLNTTGKGDTATNVYLTNLTIVPTDVDKAIKNGVCVAVYVGESLKGIWKVGNSEPIKSYGNVVVDATAGPTTAATVPVKASATNLGATALGTATDTSGLDVTFYLYLDGTDPNVKTDYAYADTLVTSITATFSTNAPG